MWLNRRSHMCTKMLVGKQEYVVITGGREGPKWHGGSYFTEMVAVRTVKKDGIPWFPQGKK